MTDTIFTFKSTPIASTWLNDVNVAVYRAQSGLTIPSTTNRTQLAKNADWISVLDFGADPTGVADSTAAFNRATQASAVFGANLAYNILIPSGTYLINGTVYVRSGQTLWGSGHGSYIVCTGTPSSTPNFVLGSSSSGADGSGSPVKIGNFRTIGGPGAAGVIKCVQAGAEIESVFMTSAGTAIDLQGCTDVLLRGIEIDQALTGINMVGAQNIQLSSFNIYLANYAFTLGGSSRDISIGDGVVEYSQYAGILFNTGSTAIRGVTIADVNFTMNQQFGTFLGYIVMQASNSEIQVTGCSFRNMYNWAVNHNTGTGNQLTFSGCIFDGLPTSSGYTSSTTAKVLNIPSGGTSTYDFQGCEFRNLLGEIATLANGITQLSFNGGLVVNCDANAASQKRFNLTGLTDWPKISVKGLKGFPYIANTAGAQAVVLPYWGPSVVWKVAVKGNPATGGSGFYAAAEEGAYAVTYQFNGTSQFTYVDKMLIWQTPTRTIPGNLAAVVCFGTAPGGATSQAGIVQTGTICVSVPTSTAANFDWSAETAC